MKLILEYSFRFFYLFIKLTNRCKLLRKICTFSIGHLALCLSVYVFLKNKNFELDFFRNYLLY